MTEVEAISAPIKEEEDKDEDESVYSDPNGKFSFLIFVLYKIHEFWIFSCGDYFIC